MMPNETNRCLRRAQLLSGMFFCASLTLAGSALAADENGPAKPVPPAVATEFTRGVRPLVEKLCRDCHSGAKPDGGLDLTKFPDAKSAVAERAAWEKVSLRLRSEEMPPPDEAQPTPAQRRQLIDSIDRLLARGPAGQRDPGRVTLHRLNRTEYNNSIRDLLGIDFHAGDDFPSDDVGYGFDNIGDVLTMPPPLIEKYLKSAQKVAEKAIRVPGDVPLETHLGVKELQSKKGVGGRVGDGRSLSSNGEVYGDSNLPADGDYRISIMAHGDQAGDEAVKMELRIDGQKSTTFDVKALRDNPERYEIDVHLGAGQHKLVAAFINDFYDPKNPDPTRRDRNLMVYYLDVSGPLGFDYARLPESHHRLIPHPPSEDNRAKDIHDFVRRFTSRAFRRPAKPEEVERLKKLIPLAEAQGDSFEQGMRLVLQAVLVSPHFLYRVEADPADSKQGRCGS